VDIEEWIVGLPGEFSVKAVWSIDSKSISAAGKIAEIPGVLETIAGRHGIISDLHSAVPSHCMDDERASGSSISKMVLAGFEFDDEPASIGAE
jgi:hypothetical protein